MEKPARASYSNNSACAKRRLSGSGVGGGGGEYDPGTRGGGGWRPWCNSGGVPGGPGKEQEGDPSEAFFRLEGV